MTFGEKAVGLSFNPSNDPKVQEVKELYAKIVDLCNDLRTEAGQSEKGRLLSVAITEAQGAQMWAVKGITWQDAGEQHGDNLGGASVTADETTSAGA